MHEVGCRVHDQHRAGCCETASGRVDEPRGRVEGAEVGNWSKPVSVRPHSDDPVKSPSSFSFFGQDHGTAVFEASPLNERSVAEDLLIVSISVDAAVGGYLFIYLFIR